MDRLADVLHEIAERLKRPSEPVADFGCPRCGGHLLERQGPFRMFLGCSNYPECNYTENLNYRVIEP